MKKTFVVLVAMLMALQLYAQKTLSGQVLDAYYKTALSGVEIKIPFYTCKF